MSANAAQSRLTSVESDIRVIVVGAGKHLISVTLPILLIKSE